MTPRVTVSLVTYNGMHWLWGCVMSVLRQKMGRLELRVVDNASTDGTLDFLRDAAAHDTRVHVVALDTNVGFAAAHNITIGEAETEFVMLLNQDVELDRFFLQAALRAFERSPDISSVQARLRRLGPEGEHTDVIDSTGLVMHRDRRVVARRQGEPEDERDLAAGPVWGVDGPAPVYRRAALLDVREPRTAGGIEVLDEDFFMYKEDVDLAWRLRKRGWRAWYEPDALAWHARGAGGGPGQRLIDIARSNRTIPYFAKALSWRNQRLMQLKNESAAEYLTDLPWIARRELLSLGFIVVADPQRLSIVPDLIRRMPGALHKRGWTPFDR